uniref:Uncharacterized protein n=1 Tax=Ascaris lumbricoides TaxID=6252 RepID=A0A9J2Q5T5_ASCLU
MGSSDTSIKALLVIAWLVLFVEYDVVAIRSFASSDQEQKARPGMGSARSFGDEQDVDFNEDDLLTQEQKKILDRRIGPLKQLKDEDDEALQLLKSGVEMNEYDEPSTTITADISPTTVAQTQPEISAQSTTTSFADISKAADPEVTSKSSYSMNAAIESLLESADVNITGYFADNATEMVMITTEEEEFDEKANLTVFWIDATYKESNENSSEGIDNAVARGLIERELVDNEKRLEQLDLPSNLLNDYKVRDLEPLIGFQAVGLFYKEICGDYDREFWYTTTDDAKKIRIHEDSLICGPFKESNENSSEGIDNAVARGLIERELVDSEKRLEQLDLPSNLLNDYKVRDPLIGFQAVGLFYKEICGDYDREFWYTTTDDAKKIRIHEDSLICGPFKEELNPNEQNLIDLARQLNERVNNLTNGDTYYNKVTAVGDASSTSTIPSSNDTETATPEIVIAPDTMEWNANFDSANDAKKSDMPLEILLQLSHLTQWNGTRTSIALMMQRRAMCHWSRNGHTVVLRVKRKVLQNSAKTTVDDDDSWFEDLLIDSSETHHATMAFVAERHSTPKNETTDLHPSLVLIDASDETKQRYFSPTMTISSFEVAKALQLDIPEYMFQRYEKIRFFLPGICADFVPTAVDEFNASDFEGVEIEGPIGVNITALEIAGVNLTELAEKLRNDTDVDEILTRTNVSTRVVHKDPKDPKVSTK